MKYNQPTKYTIISWSDEFMSSLFTTYDNVLGNVHPIITQWYIQLKKLLEVSW